MVIDMIVLNVEEVVELELKLKRLYQMVLKNVFVVKKLNNIMNFIQTIVKKINLHHIAKCVQIINVVQDEEKNIKSKKEFYKNKNQPDGFGYHCKKCKEDNFDKENRRKYIKKWTKKYNDKNPHKMAWRNLLKHTLERLGQPKEGKTIDLLGYSAINLRDYITALLTDGMSWDNYGEWHIDHIKPVSLFPKDTHPNIVNNLNNLQPLWATTREINGIIYEGNYNKGNKYVEKGLLS